MAEAHPLGPESHRCLGAEKGMTQLSNCLAYIKASEVHGGSLTDGETEALGC